MFDLFVIYHLHSTAWLTMNNSLSLPSPGWPYEPLGHGFQFFLKMWAWHAAHHHQFGGKAWAVRSLPHHRYSFIRIRIRLRGRWYSHHHLFETWVAFVRHNVFVAKHVTRVR